MVSKKIRKKRRSMINIMLVLGIIGLLSFAGFVIAETSNLEIELNNLTSDLDSSNYSWLVNYSGSDLYPSVEVYEKDSSELITTFENISVDKKYQIFLDGLGNKTQDTFDLLIKDGSVLFDYVVDPVNQTNITTYENVSDVYHDFIWDKSNIKMQVRSCDDAVCDTEQFAGPDGTSNTWYSEFDYNDLNVSEVVENQYFQFKAYMFRNVTADGRVNETFTPILKNVNITFANVTKPYIKNPVISIADSAEHFLNCTTKAYTVNAQVNITFNWTVDGNFYKTENVSSTSGVEVSSVINSTEILPWRVWNCSVQAYDGEYSDIKSTFGNSLYYDTLRSVYSGFIWHGNGMKMQVRSCDDSACSGESFIGADNTSSSYIIDPDDGNLSLTNLSANRWFQYKVYLEKTVFASLYTPKFYGVNVTSGNMSGVTECGAITQPGSYVLSNSTIVDYGATCITINASDVVFDCQGFTIDGVNTGTGIYAVGNIENVTIRNCNINHFGDGIIFEYVNNSLIENCSTNFSADDGIGLWYSSYNKIINVTATNQIDVGDVGISFSHSGYNNLTDVLIDGNYIGLQFTNDQSDSNIITRTNITNNSNSGISTTTPTADNNQFYNNFFNNTLNSNIITGSNNYFNSTKTLSTNIVGKLYVGGNYWAYPNGTGYSESCTDGDGDDICDNPLNASSGLECVGCAGVNIDELPLSRETAGVADDEYPQFSNYWDDNGTLVDSGTGLFNVTLLSTNGTVILEINSTNITASNLSTVFNTSHVFGVGGVYVYRWHSWGNGTDENYNVSIDRYYTVNVSETPSGLLTNGTLVWNWTLSNFSNQNPNVICFNFNWGQYCINESTTTSSFNFTAATFNTYNSTWDNRGLITTQIGLINTTSNIQNLINGTTLNLAGLGIGVATPTHELNVLGTINVTTDIYAMRDIYAYDDITASDDIFALNNIYAQGGVFSAGTQGVGQGAYWAYATASKVGGELRLYNSEDLDTNTDYWRFGQRYNTEDFTFQASLGASGTKNDIFTIDGTTRDVSFNNTVLYVDMDGFVGIGTATPTFPLTVFGNVSDGTYPVSIWADGNISASGYITRTSVFDSVKSPFDFIKDSNYYKNSGKINHSKFYGYVNYPVTDFSRPVNVTEKREVCEDEERLNCSIKDIIETTYPFNYIEEGVSLDKEIDVLRQAVFELDERNKLLKERIEVLEGKI